MLRIRLQRTGRTNHPAYRIVVAEKDDPIKGKFKEVVGHYLPARTEKVLEINEDRITYWIGNGALPTNTVARLLKKKGMKDMEKYMESYTKKRSKKAPPPEETPPPAPAAEAPAAEGDASAEEAPAPEAPAEEKKEEEAPAAKAPAAEEKTEEQPAEEPAATEDDTEKKES